MSDYDLQIDGKHFNFHWDRPQPPSKEDVETAVTQYRASMKSPAAAPKSAPAKTAQPSAQRKQAVRNYLKGFIGKTSAAEGTTPQEVKRLGTSQAFAAGQQRREQAIPQQRVQAMQHPSGKREAHAPNRSLLDRVQPGFDAAAAATPGARGGAAQLISGAIDSAPLAAIGGALPAALAKGVGGLFAAQMAKGAFDTARNEKLRKSDPGKYWTLLLGQAALAGAPGLPHLIKGAKAIGETGARLKESAAFEGKTANTRRAVRPVEKAAPEPHAPRTGVVRPGKGKSAPAAKEALEKAATPETAKRAPARVKRKGPAPFPEKRLKTAHVAPKEKEANALPVEKPGAGVLRQEGQGPGKGVELQRVGEGHQEPKKTASAQESTPKELKAAPAKPIYEMTPQELNEAAEAHRTRQYETEDKLFGGKEGGNRYRALYRRSNGSGARADAAAQELAQMEATLSPQDQGALYGMGDTSASFEDYRDYSRALGRLDYESPEALGHSLRFALTDLGGAPADPAQMTPRQQKAYAVLRHAMQETQAQGWDHSIVSKAALEGAASRFSDPHDAATMLKRFMNDAAPRPQESAPAAVPKALPSPPEMSAIADKEAASNAIGAEKMQPILAAAHKAALDAGGFKGVRDVPIADAYKAATKAKLLPDKYTLKDFVRDAAAVGKQEGATHHLAPAATGAGVGVRTYGKEGYAYLRGPKPSIGPTAPEEPLTAQMRAASEGIDDSLLYTHGKTNYVLTPERMQKLKQLVQEQREQLAHADLVTKEGLLAQREKDRQYEARIDDILKGMPTQAEALAKLRGPKPAEGIGKGTPKKGAQPGAISLSLKPRRQLREISNSVRNTLVEGASNFRELAAGKPSYHNATALAGAPSEANLHLRRYLPGIEKAFAGNKEDASRFYLFGQADRALTERFALNLERPLLQQKLTAARAAGDTRLARQVMGELKRVNHALNENIINRNELGTGTRPTVVDPVSKQPITGAMIEKYFAQPHVQNALKAYRPLEDLMRQNYTYDGSAANGDLGMHSNAFFPAESLGENGLPTSGGGGTGGRTAPLMKLYSKPGRGHFSGTAHAYGQVLEEGLQRRMASGLMARHAYEMASSLHQEGLMISADDPTALRLNPTSHETEININGEWEKASKPFNIQEKFSFAREYKDLPQRVVVPSRLYNELRPLFEQTQGTYTSDVSNRLNSRLIGANLMGAGEAGSHGRGLTGRLAAAIPFLKGAKWIEGAQTGPLTLLNAMLHADNAFRGKWKFSDDERYAANLEAAQAGALPHEAVRWLHFKDAPTVAGKAAVPLRNILRSGGTLLYSDRGILSNVHTAIYKYFKDSGQLAGPHAAAARAQMHDMMRSMNVHNDFLRASATKGNTLGPLVGTYAQTGIRNRVAAYRGGVGPYLLRMAGTLALADALAVASDARHRHLWQIPGVKEGDFYFGEENGKTLSFNAIDFADRTQGYGDFAVRSVLQSLSTGDSLELKARKLVMAIANQSAQPFVSGPVGQAGQRFIGQTLYPSVDPRGQTTLFFSTKRAKEGILSQEHLKYTALALLPFLQFGESEQTAKTPTTQTVHLLGDKISLRAQLLNRALRLVGANQITVVDEAKAISRAQGQMHALSGEKRGRVRGVPDPTAQINREIRRATGGY